MKLIVEKDYMHRITRLYLEDKQGDCTYFIGQKDGKMVQTLMSTMEINTDPIPPLLEFNGYMIDEFFQAVSTYMNEHNIKTDNIHRIDGELDATKNHLKYLQEITNKLVDKVTK